MGDLTFPAERPRYLKAPGGGGGNPLIPAAVKRSHCRSRGAFISRSLVFLVVLAASLSERLSWGDVRSEPRARTKEPSWQM